ncbi:NAD(P)/FAD-dependent oxidoreductase [Rhodocyclus tenuis]|uniref:NADPH-dependent 2,4-dienoyl-CoA reductase/sulfur reductase-like enzyme n=1 Tax=Rhodocyclus tenuis TaxID=1066 RepID=A0A840G6V0_RHOTE|nr:NAD(P)/FAD-dependent oxidoreductase [Rhodocyclus tenuis]MBB4246438.1 NADPH-dependent 2,4-dienoyl-CoA reductase/sulfur reductase-like enzyme [Rhodocyclus tenuis]
MSQEKEFTLPGNARTADDSLGQATVNSGRRRLLGALGAGAAIAAVQGAAFAAVRKPKSIGRVVIIGAGFGGATAAKYLRKWSNGSIDVTLIERNKQFISCPTSNEVLGGNRAYESLVHGYDKLGKNWGVKLVNASATAVDAEKRRVRTDTAGEFEYDRLIVAPGFDFNFASIEGYDEKARERILHAWKAGAQTLALRQQLVDLPDGGVYALTIPKAPYRCPPGPYERASQIAWYFKQNKPKSKVLVLDANDKIISKEKLFLGVWEKDYAGIIEYTPKWNATGVDAASNTVISELGDRLHADVLNLLPAQRAGDIARAIGIVNVNDRWADIDWITLESTALKNVHVVGDALSAAPLMPKSGHMANQHGKAVAAAIVEIFSGREPQPTLLANTCYSLVDDKRAIHVDSVHRYDPEKKQPLVVAGSGGVSSAPSVEEGLYTRAWAETIWKDVLA